MERRLEPEQQAHGSGSHLGPDREPVGCCPLNLPEQPTPRLRPVVTLGQRDRERPAGQLHQPSHHGELALGVGREVRDELDDAVSRVGHAENDGLELRRPRLQGGGRVTRRRAVVQRARGREPEGARSHGLGREAPHGGRVLFRRLLQAGRTLAHDVETERTVRKLCTQVDVVGPSFHRVEVLPEALPRPVDPFVEHRAGNVLDALHQFDQPVVRVGSDRSEAHPTVAHHRGRHAVPARRLGVRPPGGLAVVVGVDVHEAGGDQLALRVDLFGAASLNVADRDDGAGVDGDVSHEGLSAQAVGDLAASDHQIVCHARSSSLPAAAGLRGHPRSAWDTP